MVKWFLLCAVTLNSLFLQADQLITAQQNSPNYLARVEVNTAEELAGLLQRAEKLFDEGKLKGGEDTPVAFVLHGPEARALFKENYQTNKSLVDLAARLSAFKVVEINVCRTWMGSVGLDEAQLQPFISTVPYGLGEERRLLKEEGYVYF